MARAQETYGKKEREKKRLKKREEKQKKKEKSCLAASHRGLDDRVQDRNLRWRLTRGHVLAMPEKPYYTYTYSHLDPPGPTGSWAKVAKTP